MSLKKKNSSMFVIGLDEPIDNFPVGQELGDSFEEFLLFSDETDEPHERVYLRRKSVDILEKSILKDKFSKHPIEIPVVKEEPVDPLIKEESVDLLEEECPLVEDKTEETPQEAFIVKKGANGLSEDQLLIGKGDEHPQDFIIKKESVDINQFVLVKNNYFPHKTSAIQKEPDNILTDKCLGNTGKNYNVSSNASIISEKLNNNQILSVKNEPLLPIEECLLIDNTLQYCHQGGSHIKQELVDPFEECLLNLDNYDQLNSTYSNSLMEKDPFKDCEPSENHYNVEPLDGKCLIKKHISKYVYKTQIKVDNHNMPLAGIKIVSRPKEEIGISLKRGLQQKSKQLPSVKGSVTPVIPITVKKDIQVSQALKSKRRPKFYSHVDASSSSAVRPKIIRPQIDVDHSCRTSVLCTECNKCFRFVGLLRAHLLSYHGLRDVPMYHCCVCKGDFKDIYDLMSHIKRESGQNLVYCRFCNGSFVIRKHAGKYQNRTSFYVKREKCKFCQNTFKTAEFLKRHVCAVLSNLP